MAASNDDDGSNVLDTSAETSCSEKTPSDVDGCQRNLNYIAPNEKAAKTLYSIEAGSKEVVGENSVTYPDGGLRAWSAVLGG
jgi:hypothetical protein